MGAGSEMGCRESGGACAEVDGFREGVSNVEIVMGFRFGDNLLVCDYSPSCIIRSGVRGE
jgi:hypothetical protein